MTEQQVFFLELETLLKHYYSDDWYCKIQSDDGYLEVQMVIPAEYASIAGGYTIEAYGGNDCV
tara:strand:+ start:2639 stop:2827 length:189 start_codon:yes stop_codon:yes gene_type:complete